MKHLEPLTRYKCLLSCSDIHGVNLSLNLADSAWPQWTHSFNILQTKQPVRISFNKESSIVLSDKTPKLLLAIPAFGPGHAYHCKTQVGTPFRYSLNPCAHCQRHKCWWQGALLVSASSAVGRSGALTVRIHGSGTGLLGNPLCSIAW